MYYSKIIILIALSIFTLLTGALAQKSIPTPYEQTLQTRISNLENEVRTLQTKNQNATTGGVALLFGAFCALWAQNTKRNAWLWFFMGIFFSVITVVILLIKNSDDRNNRNTPNFFKKRKIDQN